MFRMDSKMARPILMKFSGKLQVSPEGDTMKFGIDRINIFFVSTARVKPR